MARPSSPSQAVPAALAVVAVLTLGACGATLAPPAHPPAATLPPEAAVRPAPDTSDAPEESGVGDPVPLRDADLADLAARMTDVLDDGTEEEWAAFFEGEDVVEEQRRWFGAVRDVPMDVRDIVPAEVVKGGAGDGADGTVVELVFAHQVTGADPRPAMETYRATVRRTDGQEARISAMEGEDSLDAHPQLWDLDAVDVTVTDHLVLLAPESRAADVAAVLPGLESATANVFLDFGTGDRDRLVVQLVDGETLVEIADDEDLAVDPAGVAMALPTLGEPPAAGEVGVGLADEHADRIVLDLDLLLAETQLGTPPGGWGLMRHEGVHALVDGDPSVRPPVWVWEGLAEWYGYRRDYLVDEAYRQAVASADGASLELPDSFSDYYYDSQEAGELAYASSAMVFSFLEQRFGFEVTRDVGVGLTRSEAWSDTDDADALLLELTGMTLEELEAEWAAWAVATYG